ncbi:signal peptide peptidase SppA [Candidatus Dependentiae bacterium]|nr:signal peptide peptidase SppA [Candidatus Dependentiae bacterium]
MAKFSELLKNLLFILLILQVAPILIKSIGKQYSSFFDLKTHVGLIDIKGTLSDSKYYIKNLKKLFENKSIKAILMRIDCPGGSSGTTQAIFNEILDLKKQYGTKPLVALIENICASGGYYIATTADHIIATPSAIIGSIGVYVQHPQFKQFIEQFKVKFDITKSGAYKTSGNPFSELTNVEKEMFQTLTDDVYKQFVNDVKQRRPQLAKSNENNWAQGKVVTGNMALQLGMIDELGSESNAIKVIKEKAPIEGEIEWIKPPKKFNLWNKITGSDDDSSSESETFFDKVISKFAAKTTEESSKVYC